MAGFAMNGIDYENSGILNLSLISEYRGDSYAVGGDKGAITFPNFIKRYNPGLHGASTHSHIISFCTNPYCGLPTSYCKC